MKRFGVGKGRPLGVNGKLRSMMSSLKMARRQPADLPAEDVRSRAYQTAYWEHHLKELLTSQEINQADSKLYHQAWELLNKVSP